MHEVRDDVVEQALVVRDDEHPARAVAERVHSPGRHAQGVDVEPGSDLAGRRLLVEERKEVDRIGPGCPRCFRTVLTAVRRKYVFETPGISTGYWNARKTPSRVRISAGIARRSFPWNRARPCVTT